ncbi:hypothetical protein [Sphingobium sp. Sx8-8]|uniref:hypothetical protein n=1 Tax=Sphingobium sp. Sx8-8 TaxID=2933617 RepID=UPI001F56F718|nr:hypothetical protein [Sphingobium sp. Sx8-8]
MTLAEIMADSGHNSIDSTMVRAPVIPSSFHLVTQGINNRFMLIVSIENDVLHGLAKTI